MIKPKISIITVVYNGAKHIEQTIRSVLEQTYSDIEYLIIDGGSTDGTVDIIKKYEDSLSYWVSEKDKGMYHAMNKGITKSNGEIIGILNSDDYYYPESISHVVKKFENTNADIVYGNVTREREIKGNAYFKEVKPNFEEMEKKMGVIHPATFVLKKVYDAIGMFNDAYKLSADYDFILRAYHSGCKFQYIDLALVVFRAGGLSDNDCNSYRESYKVLLDNRSPYAKEIKNAVYLCYLKKSYKKLIRLLAKFLFLETLLDKRIIKKWK